MPQMMQSQWRVRGAAPAREVDPKRRQRALIASLARATGRPPAAELSHVAKIFLEAYGMPGDTGTSLEKLLNDGWAYHDRESERLARELEAVADPDVALSL